MTGDAEQALFEDGIDTVPESDGKAQLAVVVADASQSIFSPAVDAGASVLVRKVRPGVAVPRVVLPHRRLSRV